MHSTQESKQTGPYEVSVGLSAQEIELVTRADERLAHAYEQIAQADEQLARANEQFSKLEHHPQGRRPSRGRPALRGLIGLLLAACIFVAAFASQSYGEAARLIVSRWALQLASASSLPLGNPGPPAQPSPPSVQMAAADAALSQPAPLVQVAPQEVAPTAAPISPGLTPLLETMARDLAIVQQRIEELKTSQEQMARDNATAAEQLRASQEQMALAIAKVSEQNLQPKSSASTPRPLTRTSKPVPTLPSTQARMQPQRPVQLQPDKR
jgi:hypothetical protein